MHSQRQTRFAAWVLGSILGATVTSGVAQAEPKPISEKIGERISRGIVEESLETLDKKENRERLGRVMNSPQIRAAMHDITESIVLGVVHGIRKARSEAGATEVDIGKSVGDSMDKHITPAVGKLTFRLVDQALTASLADKHIAQIEKLAQGSTHAVLTGVGSGLREEVGPALAATLDKDIGPAIAVMLERDIMPAVGRGLNTPEMQSAVANMTRSIATELVGGTTDAMQVNADQNKAEGKESGFKVFGSNLAIGYAVALFVAFAFGTLLVVLTVLLVRSNRRQRKQYEDAKQREATLMHLLDSVDADHPELRTDMHRLVREQINTEQP
jgi:heme exporter protein D